LQKDKEKKMLYVPIEGFYAEQQEQAPPRSIFRIMGSLVSSFMLPTVAPDYMSNHYRPPEPPAPLSQEVQIEQVEV